MMLKKWVSFSSYTEVGKKQACKPQTYAISKLCVTDQLTGAKCRATSVAKKKIEQVKVSFYLQVQSWKIKR